MAKRIKYEDDTLCIHAGEDHHGRNDSITTDVVNSAVFVLDGILNNDLFIVAEPEYRTGVEARCNALLESMVQFKPLPAEMLKGNYLRTPIYVQEIAHRKATQMRNISGT